MITLILHKDKTTPGTVRFKEDGEDHPIALYLTKQRVSELGNPESIKVTIEPEA